MSYVWYEEYSEDEEQPKQEEVKESRRLGKPRKPRNTAFLNDDHPGAKFFKRKKHRIKKKSSES